MKKLFSVLLAGLMAASMTAVASAEIPEGLVIHEWVEGNANEGADCLFDYDESTKWCHSSPWSYVVWEMPESVAITGYQMVTANDNEQYPGRNPSAWTLYGCNDYDAEAADGTWEEIDVVEGDTTLEDTNFTPYTFELDAQAPAYKYYMLEINEIAGGGVFQMSGFNLIYEGQAAQEMKSAEEMAAEEEAKKAAAEAEAQAAQEALFAEHNYQGAVSLKPVEGITFISGTDGFSEAEGAASMFDYTIDTKWCSDKGDFQAVWQMPEAVAITGYQMVTAGDTQMYPDRNPTAWTLSGSTDGENWTVIDTRADDTTMFGVNNTAFDFMLDAAAPAYDYFKLDGITVGGSLIQIADFNLIFDGAIADAPVVEETEAPAEETEAPAVEETEAPVVDEVVDTAAPETEEKEDAPQTFDAAIIAGVAAVVSLAGYAVAKKH